MDAETYSKVLDQMEVQNRQRGDDSEIDARSVSDALAALGLTDSAADDPHPEK